MTMSNRRSILATIRNFLRMSSRLHIRQGNIASDFELFSLLDRFIVGNIRYPLEWDDFISWENEVPHIEEFRIRIGAYEKFLFSNEPHDRNIYQDKIIEERNRLAKSLGVEIGGHNTGVDP